MRSSSRPLPDPDRQEISGDGDRGAPLSFRERKKIATRETIIVSALRVFAKKGFDATTVDEVAEAANVSPRTFFRYFGTKESVVFGDEQLELDHLRAVFRQTSPELDAWDAMVDALLEFAVFISERRDRVLARFHLVVDAPTLLLHAFKLQKRYEGLLAKELARREGRDHPAVGDRLIAATGFSAFVVANEVWQENGGEGDLRKLTLEALSTVTPVGGSRRRKSSHASSQR